MSSTPKAPLAQIGSDVKPEKKPMENGLIIGILCGVLGFFVVVVICVVVIQKIFKRKKKTRDEKVGSGAQLLTDDVQIRKDTNGKYNISSLGPKKCSSCPDIYAVNQSILLKLGSTSHLYEQLEKDSARGGTHRYKSEQLLADRNTSEPSLNDSFNKISGDERDGKVFDDEGNIYQTPSMFNTFQRKPRDHTQTSHNSSRDFLHPEDNFGTHAHGDEGISGYESDQEAYLSSNHDSTSHSPKHQLKSDVGGVYSSETVKNDACAGYQTPTSTSPYLIPKSRSFNTILLRDNVSHSSDAEDNIYDVPKLDNQDRIYYNLPGDLHNFRRDNQIENRDNLYKTPLNSVQMENTRSYTVGSVVRKKKVHSRDRVYEDPSSKSFYSQPSLLNATSADKINPCEMTTGYHDDFSDDNTYDVPSQLRSGKPYVNVNLSKEESNCKVKDIINSMRDNHLINDSTHNNSDNGFSKAERSNDEPRDVAREMAYDVPHNVTPVDANHYKNLSPTNEMTRNAAHLKKLGYDVPSTVPVFDPSQPWLLKQASKNFYKSDGSDKTYDVPSNVPDFDPSLVYTKKPINKKINNNDNRSKHFDVADLIYDIPSSRDQTTIPATSSSSENNELSSRSDNDSNTNDDAIYQNVFQTEDGRTRLRSYVPPHPP